VRKRPSKSLERTPERILAGNLLVRWRVYPSIVITCGIASGLLLSQAYVYDVTILAKCGGVPATWLWVNWLPGLACVAFWVFCSRYSMRRAGAIVSLGTVLCSAYAMLRASDSNRAGGDMACILLLPDGVLVGMFVVVGSLIARIGASLNETRPVVPRLPPNKSAERTRER
jgi:hypothetical protein